jgi:hypothetical protein
MFGTSLRANVKIRVTYIDRVLELLNIYSLNYELMLPLLDLGTEKAETME